MLNQKNSMAEVSSEIRQPAPIDIKLPLYRKDFAYSATGEVRRKLDTQIQVDYTRLLTIKTQSPDRWQAYLSAVRNDREANERFGKSYRESTRQAWLKARNTLENHPLYKLVRRLDTNFDTHLKEAVQVAKELGKPYEEIPPDFAQALERLLKEADTGNPVPLEHKAAA
jgi:hypothetical protein